MGGLWRLYYGGNFGQRLGGKYGPLTVLMAVLAFTLWMFSDNVYTVSLALPMAFLWIQGFDQWDKWVPMMVRYNVYTWPIAAAWIFLESDPWFLLYGLSGLSGLAYPVLNRLQPTSLLRYTQWAEVITGIAMIDTVIVLAWLA